MTRKKIERRYLDYLSGWMHAQRDHFCVGEAIKQDGGGWQVHSTTLSTEEWKFRYALEMHGKDPNNAISRTSHLDPKSSPKDLWNQKTLIQSAFAASEQSPCFS
jgi:hypothetical protein